MSDPSDENNPSAVLAAQSADPALARENAELRAKLAALEQANVVDGRFAGELPKYFLNGPCFLDDVWFAAGSTIEYTGVPNLDMAPMNKPAHVMSERYTKVLTDGGQRVAALRGRDFTGLVNDRNILIDLAREDAKRQAEAPVQVVAVPQRHDAPPAMPHLDEARAIERRGPGRPRKVISSTPPDVTGGMRPDVRNQMLAPAPAPQIGPAILGRVISG